MRAALSWLERVVESDAFFWALMLLAGTAATAGVAVLIVVLNRGACV